MSHASERECVDELQREATRLQQLLRGRPTLAAAALPASEPVTSGWFGRDAHRSWSPARDRERSAAVVSLSLAGSAA